MLRLEPGDSFRGAAAENTWAIVDAQTASLQSVLHISDRFAL
jgi:hypothetical protein